MPFRQYPAVFKFRGGHPALDFCNTVHWRRRPVYRELLIDYGHLVDWARAAAVVSTPEGRQLEQLAAEHPQLSDARLQAARATRDALHDLLAARAAGQTPPEPDRVAVSQAVAEAAAQAELVAGDGHYSLVVPAVTLDTILWRVMLSASALLTGPLINRVGQCQDPRGCGWLFLDTTRNHSRRWCAMDDCGSLDKARNYYRRAKAIAGKEEVAEPGPRAIEP